MTRVNPRNGFPKDESTIKIAGADKITLMTWQGALMTTTWKRFHAWFTARPLRRPTTS